MKVLHLFNQIEYSGAEIMYAQASSLFNEKSIELYAFSTGKDIGSYANEFRKKGIIVEHNYYPNDKLKLGTKLLSLIKLYRYIKENNIGVLHIHRSDLYLAAFIAFVCNITCIKSVHNCFGSRRLTHKFHTFQRYIAREILNVKYHSIGFSVYNNELEYYKNKSVRINNWYDDKLFYPETSSSEKNNIRKELNIPHDAFIIISVGSCSHVKQHEHIIRALSIVNSQVKCHYLHIGSGILEEEEKNIAQDLNIIDSIQFIGQTNCVRKYLIASDLYIMPSKFEGLTIAVLEAMACALPSVLYNADGLRDLIDDNDAGLLIKSNYEELAKSIVYLYNNPDLRNEMIHNAVEKVNSEYCIDKSVSEIVKLYKYKVVESGN